jgi:hypothetical protein
MRNVVLPRAIRANANQLANFIAQRPATDRAALAAIKQRIEDILAGSYRRKGCSNAIRNPLRHALIEHGGLSGTVGVEATDEATIAFDALCHMWRGYQSVLGTFIGQEGIGVLPPERRIAIAFILLSASDPSEPAPILDG